MTKPRKRKPKRSDYTRYPETGSHIDALTRRRKKAKPVPWDAMSRVVALEAKSAVLKARVDALHGWCKALEAKVDKSQRYISTDGRLTLIPMSEWEDRSER